MLAMPGGRSVRLQAKGPVPRRRPAEGRAARVPALGGTNGEVDMRKAPIIASLALFGLIGIAGGSAMARPLKPEQKAKIKPAGKPESCIPLHRIRETRVRSDSVIDFYTLGGKVYRNTLPHSCPSLGFEEKFLYKTSLSQLCSTDIITVLRSGGDLMPGASCGLGQFQPVTGAPR